MGAVFAVNTSMATLLAIIIGLQNLPEAFNAFRDLVLSGMTIKNIDDFFVLSFLGIPTALFGHYVLSNSATITAQLMTFASGGILYLLIQDIIPASKLKSNYINCIRRYGWLLVGIVGSKIV